MAIGLGSKGFKVLAIGGLAGACLMLSACAPTEFGMSQKQFQSLNPQQQQAVMASYNQRQQQEEELGDALGLLGSVAHVSAGASHSNYHEHRGAWHCDGGSCSRSGSSSSNGSSVSFGF